MARVDVRWSPEKTTKDDESDKSGLSSQADEQISLDNKPSASFDSDSRIEPEPSLSEEDKEPIRSSSETNASDIEEAPAVTDSDASSQPQPDASSSPPPEQPPNVAVTSGPKKSGAGHLVLDVVLVLAVIGLALWSWTLYSDKQVVTNQYNALKANPQAAVQKQSDQAVKNLLAKVGKLIQLPANETPTIANVTDATQAKKQSAFFANTVNGDKLLMYVKAGEAILYRPSTNKIIVVGPLTFTNNSATKSSTTSTTTTPTTGSDKTSPTTSSPTTTPTTNPTSPAKPTATH